MQIKINTAYKSNKLLYIQNIYFLLLTARDKMRYCKKGSDSHTFKFYWETPIYNRLLHSLECVNKI